MQPFPATTRINSLRAQLLAEKTIPREEPELLWGRAWLASGDEPWNIVRRARATSAVLEGITPEIGRHELLVGTFSRRNLSDEERAELQRWRQEQAPASSPVWGQRAHMAIDYEVLLRRGLRGLDAQIALYRQRLDLTRPEDLERDAFYRACEIALDGLRRLSERYADEADRQAASLAVDDPRASELREIARVCRRVPEYPAETFREALQAVHLVTFALCAGQLMLLFQLGRPDRYLLPLYRRDVAEGRLTPEEAQELIDCLCLMLSSYTPRGLAVGFMIGGRDASGRDVSNELTELFLESIAHTRMAYPGIGLCWNEDMPDAIMERACDLLADGLTHPALFGDDLITRGMLEAGLPPAEACLYQHSTCVELTPVASSNVYVASPYINLVQLLHDLLGISPLGEETERVEAAQSFGSFEDLLEAYKNHLGEAIREAVIEQNTAQMTRYYHGGFPLLSCFVNDCLARGRDIDQGGARYNWIEPSFVGLANLVDALVAIRQYVFEEEVLDLDGLRGALASDFAGREDLRLMFLQRAPKYGNDDDAVDDLAVQLTAFIAKEVRRYRTYLGGTYHPGFFCWVMHERLGRVTAASADGRHAGQALGDGSGPAQGRERQGPTAAVLSATKWDHAPMLGGIAVNLRFTRSQQPADFREGLRSLVETYLRRGGLEIQVNVVDTETLKAAREHPEAYRDLVVRIGGYSDYFVGLSPQMQEEIIMRTEHQGL
ncbi:MAG: hypothetical protein J7M15_02130 [Anaerolineae bacterium]|nr:hypothetical protein [Anaerolineae bacterium]